MKKISLLAIGLFSMAFSYAQEISDALLYSQSEIQGTARFRALSGAFGALGGDMSAVSINPASSAVFTRSHFSFTLSNLNAKNNTDYFGNNVKTNESTFDVNQGGAAFVFSSRSNSPWKKLTLGIAYDKTNDYNNSWNAIGVNTNDDGNFSNSIASYFYDYTDGLEKYIFTPSGQELVDYFYINNSQAQNDPEQFFDNNPHLYYELGYQFLGEVENYGVQQAFLGYQAYILDPVEDTDENTEYIANVGTGNFTHDYLYTSTGYNGKIAFNFATQYEDNLYLGINLNSHFINYDRTTSLLEDNDNGGAITAIDFDNTLSTTGNGFSFQVGGIYKLTPEFRIGLTYDSPTWYTIEEETTQYINSNNAPNDIGFISTIVNVYPRYKLKTPSKITGSLAYVFGNRGLISFDYSNKDYSKTEFQPTNDAFYQEQNEIMSNVFTSSSTYRIGGELKHKQFSFRGGYRFEESPYEDGITVGDLEGYSLGLGISFGKTKLDLTYDQWERSYATPLYNLGLIDTASINRKNSNLTLSLAFNI
ncbi:OmpP1/FadL family transporter [Neotamlana laminarinivorans]|uniref:Outer membrane protein transport protein n=1 Tax=Neotamlana laminarinivorans TaxID=2883124 RepID=A0A9X1HWQ6_9FLAO|nr:outer membrane protein transport protein [Tamlana laminarinivorans]MCB4797275.1 outer membrane protein transport protein [Tamlana laminarinivorans]